MSRRHPETPFKPFAHTAPRHIARGRCNELGLVVHSLAARLLEIDVANLVGACRSGRFPATEVLKEDNGRTWYGIPPAVVRGWLETAAKPVPEWLAASRPDLADSR